MILVLKIKKITHFPLSFDLQQKLKIIRYVFYITLTALWRFCLKETRLNPGKQLGTWY